MENKMKMFLTHRILIHVMALLAISLSGCGKVERYVHYEAFVTDVSEQNEDGLSKATGFKKINAITVVEEGEHHLKTEIKEIADYFDLEGKYIKTELVHTRSNKSKITLVEDGDRKKEILYEPSTILILDERLKERSDIDLTEEEKIQVKKHVAAVWSNYF